MPFRPIPAWHELKIQAAGDAGQRRADIDRLFDAAIAREPGYQQVWYTRLNYLAPKWGGSTEAMVALVNRGRTANAPTEGSGMMARLIQIASEIGDPEVADSPAIDWAAVKVSFDDVLKRYPDDWNAQWYFFEACMHADKPEARHLLAFVKEPPSPALFERNVPVVGKCVDWATDKLPAFAVRDPSTGSVKFIR